ncbi:hypothetical protein KM043_011983 [Ampulex compressa]|nr:hypothetical protein KM043_011983 [Ampulex compressa]
MLFPKYSSNRERERERCSALCHRRPHFLAQARSSKNNHEIPRLRLVPNIPPREIHQKKKTISRKKRRSPLEARLDSRLVVKEGKRRGALNDPRFRGRAEEGEGGERVEANPLRVPPREARGQSCWDWVSLKC